MLSSDLPGIMHGIIVEKAGIVIYTVGAGDSKLIKGMGGID